jgi:hypothetical protein
MTKVNARIITPAFQPLDKESYRQTPKRTTQDGILTLARREYQGEMARKQTPGKGCGLPGAVHTNKTKRRKLKR